MLATLTPDKDKRYTLQTLRPTTKTHDISNRVNYAILTFKVSEVSPQWSGMWLNKYDISRKTTQSRIAWLNHRLPDTIMDRLLESACFKSCGNMPTHNYLICQLRMVSCAESITVQ